MKRVLGLLAAAAVLTLALVSMLGACRAGQPRLRGSLTIVSGSENSTLEPIIERFAREHRVEIQMKYLGSVDIMLELKAAEFPYDAVWPANSLWVSLGDRERRVKYLKSIVTSPVVFGIRRSKAEALGFVGRQVHVRDILEAIRSGSFPAASGRTSTTDFGARRRHAGGPPGRRPRPGTPQTPCPPPAASPPLDAPALRARPPA